MPSMNGPEQPRLPSDNIPSKSFQPPDCQDSSDLPSDAYEAISHGNLAVVSRLLDGGMLTAAQMQTALALASGRDQVDVFRLLDQRLGTLGSEMYDTALSVAANCGHVGIFRYFIEEKRLSLAEIEPWALSIAASHGHLALISLLVEAGASLEGSGSFERPNPTPPLHAAVLGGKFDASRYLVERGAPITLLGEDATRWAQGRYPELAVYLGLAKRIVECAKSHSPSEEFGRFLGLQADQLRSDAFSPVAPWQQQPFAQTVLGAAVVAAVFSAGFEHSGVSLLRELARADVERIRNTGLDWPRYSLLVNRLLESTAGLENLRDEIAETVVFPAWTVGFHGVRGAAAMNRPTVEAQLSMLKGYVGSLVVSGKSTVDLAALQISWGKEENRIPPTFRPERLSNNPSTAFAAVVGFSPRQAFEFVPMFLSHYSAHVSARGRGEQTISLIGEEGRRTVESLLHVADWREKMEED